MLPYDVAQHVCRRYGATLAAMGPEYQWGDPRDPRLVVVLSSTNEPLVDELETISGVLVGYTDDSAPCDGCGCIVDTVPTSHWWRPDFVVANDGKRYCMNCAEWAVLLKDPSDNDALLVRQIVVSQPPTLRTMIAAGYWPTTLPRPQETDIGNGVVVLHGDEWVVYLPAGDRRLNDYSVWSTSAPCDSVDLAVIARGLFVSEFGAGVESGEFGANINANGCDWYDLAPIEPDPAAVRMARQVVCDWVGANYLADSLGEIFDGLARAGVEVDSDGVREAILRGATLAAMGYGITWSDYHPRVDERVFSTDSPCAEFDWSFLEFENEYDENGDVAREGEES